MEGEHIEVPKTINSKSKAQQQQDARALKYELKHVYVKKEPSTDAGRSRVANAQAKRAKKNAQRKSHVR